MRLPKSLRGFLDSEQDGKPSGCITRDAGPMVQGAGDVRNRALSLIPQRPQVCLFLCCNLTSNSVVRDSEWLS